MSSTKYPKALTDVTDILKTLPGVGKRSAERMAFSMLKWQDEKLKALGESLKTLKEKITSCPKCGNLASEGGLCDVCASPSRDKSIVCVVEDAAQIFSIEDNGFFRGVYHVLGGKLSPLEGKSVDDLSIGALGKRIESHGVKELILALSSDVEGQATAVYIAETFKDFPLKITRLAQGLPAGSDISYADSATIAAAFNGRTVL
jgi:recombination protein RecR